MLKRWVLVNLLVLLSGAVQINWAVQGGLSGSDMGLSPWLHTEMLCLYPLLITNILLFLFEKNNSSCLTQASILSTTVCIYWFLVNYLNFNIYVASWSTFSASEIWIHVAIRSLLTIGCCGMFLFTSLYFLLKGPR